MRQMGEDCIGIGGLGDNNLITSFVALWNTIWEQEIGSF